MGGTASHTAIAPANASATYFVNTGGTESSSPAAISNTWLLSGAAADYEVRATLSSGTTPTGGSGLNVWLSLGTSRSWSNANADDFTSTVTSGLTIEVRSAATLAVLDAASVTLTARVII